MNYASLLNSLLVAVFRDAATERVYYIVSTTFIVLMFVAAIAAIVLVFLQPGNSQGIDALGGSSETFYGKNKGRSTESTLKRWTIICLAILAVFAIVFFILQIDGIWA